MINVSKCFGLVEKRPSRWIVTVAHPEAEKRGAGGDQAPRSGFLGLTQSISRLTTLLPLPLPLLTLLLLLLPMLRLSCAARCSCGFDQNPDEPTDCSVDDAPTLRFEPYLVVRKTHLLPKFDERFLGYGKNKIQWSANARRAEKPFGGREVGKAESRAG